MFYFKPSKILILLCILFPLFLFIALQSQTLKFHLKYIILPILDNYHLLRSLDDSKRVREFKSNKYENFYSIDTNLKKENQFKNDKMYIEKNVYELPLTNYYSNNQKPVGYLAKNSNNNFIITGDGYIFNYLITADKSLELIKINSNISEFSGYEFLKSPGIYGIKGAYADNKYLYISYTKEVKKNCFNTSLIKGEINDSFINFSELFTFPECVHRSLSLAHAAGGAVNEYSNNELIFTIGDYLHTTYTDRPLAQNLKSLFGKIIKINKNDGSYQILSMGHRNPQGVFHQVEKNKILSVEHGPIGGDEVNLYKSNSAGIKNFGWPISSYGEFSHTNRKKTTNASLFKNHKKHNFIEPIKYYVPSIGISSIIPSNENNLYIIGAMGNNLDEGDMSLHIAQIEEGDNIFNTKKIIELNDRIRSINYFDKSYVMLTENLPRLIIFDLYLN